MAKKLITIALFLLVQIVFSQKSTCESPKESFVDLNTITKCSLGEDKNDKTNSIVSRKSKRITIQISRNRTIRRKNAVSSNAIIEKRSLSDLKKDSDLAKSISLNSNVMEKIPFDLVEEKPVFSKCKDVPIKQQEACFGKQVMAHVRKNFKYPPEAYRKGIQGRVFAQFVVGVDGEIEDLSVRGPYGGGILEDEAERIIRKLPKFQPGKHNSKTVKVKVGVPISFAIPGRAPTNVKKVKEDIDPNDIVNFSVVESIPLFRKCSNVVKDESLDCFNSQMMLHIQKYFEYPQEAVEAGIEGKVYVFFVIDKEGDVVNIESRGPNGGQALNNMAELVVKKLPQFISGKQGGKSVNVKYVIPINFKLN